MRDPDRIASAGAPGIEDLPHATHELPRAFATPPRAGVREIAGPGFDLGGIDRRPELFLPVAEVHFGKSGIVIHAQVGPQRDDGLSQFGATRQR